MSRDITQTEWRKKREIVLGRDDYECQECGKPESDVESLHVHHNRPVSEGGSHDLENLRTLCQSCHYEFHAEDRRNGTLEDVKDIYIRSEAPVFGTGEIHSFLGCSESQVTPKLRKLVDSGFLKKIGRGVYAKSDLPVETGRVSATGYVIVDGVLVKEGEYIGGEDKTIQCSECGKWLYSSEGDLEGAMRSHKYSCSE